MSPAIAVILLLTSFSYGYLLLAIFFKSAMLGPDYSDRAFLTLQSGAALNFVLFSIAAFLKSQLRILLLGTTFTVGLAWLLVFAINMTIDLDREADGRWIADTLELPGVMCYGQTREEAISKVELLAIESITDRIAHSELAPAALDIAFSIPDEHLALR